MNSNHEAIHMGRLYRHFKGSLYKVIGMSKHTETGETLVLYHRIDDSNNIWARPIDMFLSEVDHEKYPDVEQKMRFELVNFAD